MAMTVYTDGACLGNPGPGGWAWAVPGGRWASGPDPQTTNQRMEIRAVWQAVRAVDGPVEVASDSTYVVNCFRDRWWEGWLVRGWKNKAGKPVANRDLWEPLIDLVQQRGGVTFKWVKGHSGDPTNDLVDRLAVEAATTQEGRAGDVPPTDLGPPDAPSAGPGSGTDPRLPAGHLVAVVGLRPPELGGYGDSEVAAEVRAKLAEILAAKREMHENLVVLTGLGLGSEQLGAEAALDAGVPYVAVLPYPDADSVWPAASRDRFRSLLERASNQVLLQRKRPESRQQAGGALARRDAFLVRNADEAIAVWDGRDQAVGRLVRSFEDRLGDDVWVLEPPS